MVLEKALILTSCVCSILMFEQHDYAIKEEFMKVDYVNPDLHANAIMKPVKVNRTYTTYLLTWYQVVDADAKLPKINFKAFKFADNIPKILLADMDVRACDSIKKNFLGLKDVILNGNFSFCNITKGYYYLMFDQLDSPFYPPYILSGRYKLLVTFILHRTTTMKMSIYLEVMYPVQSKKKN